MAEIYLIRQGKSLVPANESDLESLQKLKINHVYKADIVSPRNLKFHKKFFGLLNLTFGYWEPETLTAEIEIQTTGRFAQFLCRHGVSVEAVESLQSAFIAELEHHRAEYKHDRDFDSFRQWVTIKAGFYTVVSTPAGLRKVPKSISFAACDDADFGNCYKAVLAVCWQLCLHKIFENQQQLAEELLRFE